MEPQTDLPALVEDLEVNIDELGDALAPLLSAPLATTASSLPLLDKAKLCVLAAYAVESLLFSALQASGIPAKDHAVFPELARLKAYFAKISDVEQRGARPPTKLDVGAAQRFIKHGLSGNDKYDLQRREREAKDKARAALKARQINKKFDDEDEDVTPKKRSAEHDPETHGSLTTAEDASTENHASKKPRIPTTDTTAAAATSKKRKSRSKKSAPHDSPPLDSHVPTDPTATTTHNPRHQNPNAYDAHLPEEASVPPPDPPKTFNKQLSGADTPAVPNTKSQDAIKRKKAKRKGK